MTARTRSALESFAADDTLCHLVGQQMSIPTVRTWVHDQTVVLGIQDHRLPHISEAISMLENAGYNAIVRNSGGLAVVLDEGVLNISIVLSEHDSSIDIPAGYEVMLAFVRMLFPEAGDRIEAYEIVDRTVQVRMILVSMAANSPAFHSADCVKASRSKSIFALKEVGQNVPS